MAEEKKSKVIPVQVSFKKAFITGASGFVGRALIEDLLARKVAVSALVRSAQSRKTLIDLGVPEASIHIGDVSDKKSLVKAAAGADVAFHCAAKVAMWGDWKEFLEDTVQGTANALAAAKEAGVACFVHVGTEAGCVGFDAGPLVNVDETTPTYPDERAAGPYSRSKAMAENLVSEANSASFRTVIVRPRSIWGRGDTVVMAMNAAAVRSGSFSWFDHGQSRTTSCHIRNCVEGMLLAAEKGKGGEAYFLADREPPFTMKEFVTATLSTQGIDMSKFDIPNVSFERARGVAACLEGAWKVMSFKSPPPIMTQWLLLVGQEITLNDQKARTQLGYSSHVTREEGLQELRDDFQASQH